MPKSDSERERDNGLKPCPSQTADLQNSSVPDGTRATHRGNRSYVRFVQRRAVSEEVPVGTEIPGGWGRGRLYLTLHCHHQNDSCMKMGSDEVCREFNVSHIVRDKVKDDNVHRP